MTNQVNQEFEKWRESPEGIEANSWSCTMSYTASENFNAGFEAATKASESEINSLKERVAELQSHLSNQVIEISLNDITLEAYASKIAELQADNAIMRDTLNKIALGHVYDADIIESTGDCLQRLSNSQSLAERKEVYEAKLMAECTDPNA